MSNNYNHANLRVATRIYDVEGGAIFSKNSTFVFFDGAAWTRAYGLRPRLWFLIPYAHTFREVFYISFAPFQ